jgi:hypothetical protein
MMNDDPCPRLVILEDLNQDIQLAVDSGNHIVCMLDGNDGMRKGPIEEHMEQFNLWEVYLVQELKTGSY